METDEMREVPRFQAYYGNGLPMRLKFIIPKSFMFWITEGKLLYNTGTGFGLPSSFKFTNQQDAETYIKTALEKCKKITSTIIHSKIYS
jgi:hypothetical protein